MILVDYKSVSSIVLTWYMKKFPNADDHELRTSLLSRFVQLNRQWLDKYGSMYIINDEKTWRRGVYPEYKKQRKKKKEESEYDWPRIQKIENEVFEILDQQTQWPCFQAPGAEADDIIAYMVRNVPARPVLIISRDSDFFQLHDTFNKDILQYDIVGKKFVKPETSSEVFLFNTIVKGSRKENIANIFMPINHYTDGDGSKSKSVTAKYLAEALEIGVEEEHKKRFDENKNLIDLSCTPDDVQKAIKEDIKEKMDRPKKSLQKIQLWLSKNKYRNLAADINFFKFRTR